MALHQKVAKGRCVLAELSGCAALLEHSSHCCLVLQNVFVEVRKNCPIGRNPEQGQHAEDHHLLVGVKRKYKKCRESRQSESLGE